MLIFCLFPSKNSRFITNGINSRSNFLCVSLGNCFQCTMYTLYFLSVSLSHSLSIHLYLARSFYLLMWVCVCFYVCWSVSVVVIVAEILLLGQFQCCERKCWSSDLFMLKSAMEREEKTHVNLWFHGRIITIQLLTDFTVVFMNSFLCVRSKSGYFEYTWRHTVFMVISSRFALSRISLTTFFISSSWNDRRAIDANN